MASRDPDDWPTLALALRLAVPIWSQDKDFSVPAKQVRHALYVLRRA